MSEQGMINEDINWKKLCLRFIRQFWIIIGAGVAGAVIGSSLYLLIETVFKGPAQYEVTGGFYITFADGVLDAHDYYNAYTWNSVIHQDQIMNTVMEELSLCGMESLTRSEVENMTTADILSDVRYLTIQVKGSNSDALIPVFDAMEKALYEFGQYMDEFKSITLTHCNEAGKVSNKDFTLRAGFLGGMIGIVISFLIWVFMYTVDDSVYVAEDIEKRYGLQVLGMRFKKTDDTRHQSEAEAFKNELESNIENISGNRKVMEIQVGDITTLTKESLDKIAENESIILNIPFGIHNGTMVSRYIQDIRQRHIDIAGVILTECDIRWMVQYYKIR